MRCARARPRVLARTYHGGPTRVTKTTTTTPTKHGQQHKHSTIRQSHLTNPTKAVYAKFELHIAKCSTNILTVYGQTMLFYQLASRIPRTDEEAFALFRRLINNYPDSEWADDSMYAIAFASYQIAEQLKKTGTLESVDAYYDRALALYNQLTAIYPGSELSDQAEFNKAMCYYGKGELNLALAQFDALREPFSDSPLLYQILYVTGEIYIKKQDYESARVEFTNVVDSGDPDLSPLASFGIPQTYLAEGKYQEAIDGYQRVIDLYPDAKVGQDAYFYMGWAYERLGKYDEAIARLEEAIDLYPRNENAANSQIYIGQIAYANNDMASAIDAYHKGSQTTALTITITGGRHSTG